MEKNKNVGKNTKKTTNKKNTNKKKTNVNKTKSVNNKKEINIKEEQTNIEVKHIEKNNKKSKKDKSVNKPDVNAYVNVLFDNKEYKSSIITNIIITILIFVIVGLGIYIFINHKDKIIDNIYDKNVHVQEEKPKSKPHPKPERQPIVVDKVQDTDKIAILTFHRISTQEVKDKYFKNNEWVESVDMFEKQMKYLHDNNYKTLNLDEFNCWYDNECKFDKKTVVLTFDDGDLSFYYLAAPILKKYDLKATMFIVGSYTKDQEVEYTDTKRLFIAKDTLERSRTEYPNIFYESHSYNFHNSDDKKKVLDMTKVELQEDFDKNKEFGFKYIAYPFGNYDDALLEKVEQNGYIMGFTFRKYDYATRDSKRYEIPRFKINGESNIETIEKILNY